MKQLGNLAIVCAKKEGVRLCLENGMVMIQIVRPPYRIMLSAAWNDDKEINWIIHALNFDKI